jgi:hypothetical protein
MTTWCASETASTARLSVAALVRTHDDDARRSAVPDRGKSDVFEDFCIADSTAQDSRELSSGATHLVEGMAWSTPEGRTTAPAAGAVMADLPITKADEASAGENDPLGHGGIRVGRRDTESE